MRLVGKDVFWNYCLSLYCNTCTNNIIILMLGTQYSCFHLCHLSDMLSLFFCHLVTSSVSMATLVIMRGVQKDWIQ